MKSRSIYEMFASQAERLGDKVFLRRKVDGKWEDISWNYMKDKVDTVAKAIVRTGVEPGKAIGILSESCVEWTYTDLGIVSTGCVTTAAYPTSPPEDVAYVLGHAEVPMVFAENKEQLDKVLEKLSDLPDVKNIIVYNMEGVAAHDMVMSFDDFLKLGKSAGPEIAEEWQKREKAIDHETLLTFIYTSGTTGPPKGAMLTHGNGIFIAETSAAMNFVMPDEGSMCLRYKGGVR